MFASHDVNTRFFYALYNNVCCVILPIQFNELPLYTKRLSECVIEKRILIREVEKIKQRNNLAKRRNNLLKLEKKKNEI